jgi:hypothetical protein
VNRAGGNPPQLSLFSVAVTHTSLFSPCDAFISELAECIEENHPHATLIPWAADREGDSGAAIESVTIALESLGWVWNESAKQLERGGWYVWFRSQGRLSSPIAQWNKLG